MPKKKANEVTVEPSPVDTAAVPVVKKTRAKAAAQPSVEKAAKPAAARKKAAPKTVASVVAETVVSGLVPLAEATALAPAVESWQIEELAYRSWLGRGCPVGSPDEDWYHAEKELLARTAVAAK